VSEHNFFIASLGGSAPYAETPSDVAADYWDCSNDDNIRVTYIENPAPETSNSKKIKNPWHLLAGESSLTYNRFQQSQKNLVILECTA